MADSARNVSALVPKSLLAGAEVQGELIPVEQLPDSFYEVEESGVNATTPRYTAERFFRKREDDYRTCVSLIAAGMGRLKIARLLKIHHETVAAVAERETSAVDIAKQEIKRHLRRAAMIGAERMPDVLASLPAGQLPIALAVTIDKLRELEGEPTVRVEHTVKAHLTYEAVVASIQAFPEAIDVEASPMVSRAGLPGEKGAAAAGLDASQGAGSAPTSAQGNAPSTP